MTALTVAAVDKEAIHERVSFEIVMRNLQGNHWAFSALSFAKIPLTDERLDALLAALATNTTCRQLNLSATGLTDARMQRLAIALSTGTAAQLELIDVRANPFTLVGETIAQGVHKLRPGLRFELGSECGAVDGFVHDKALIEGLTAWPAASLAINADELRCPPEIAGDAEEVLPLKKGFQGTNGTKYTCEHAEFELGHGTGNLVLKRLEPAAMLRLGLGVGGGDGTLV